MTSITSDRKQELLQGALEGSLGLENLTEKEIDFLEDFCVAFKEEYGKALELMISITGDWQPGCYPQAWRDGYYSILKQWTNVTKLLMRIGK
tara:strand:+ start:643 stop:918 length:276 start_codon:yes stop_codon:yes gene_type:complete